MAKQITTSARGNAGTKPTPGPTPAPVYANPTGRVKDPTLGYGNNLDISPSSIAPGRKVSSALADELKRVNGKSDAGDALQSVIQNGARGSVDFQTREVSSKGYAINPGTRGASSGGTIPAKIGASIVRPTRKP